MEEACFHASEEVILSLFFQFWKKSQFVYLAMRNGVCGFPKFLFEQQQEVKFRPGKGSKKTIQIMNFETKTKKFLNVRYRKNAMTTYNTYIHYSINRKIQKI